MAKSNPLYKLDDLLKGLKLPNLSTSSSPRARPRALASAQASAKRVAKENGATHMIVSVGGRNNRLTQLAGTLRNKDVSYDVARATLTAENETFTEPLEDDELLKVLNSIYGRYPPGVQPVVTDVGLNDTGNGHRLSLQHGDKIRYVSDIGQWMVWNGSIWALGDSSTVMELAKHTASSIYREAEQECDDSKRRALSLHANKSHNVSSLKAMIESAKTIPQLTIHSSQLNSNGWLLGVGNGVVDLRTGRLQPYSRDMYLTMASPVVFDPKAKAPRFKKFIDEVTCGDRALGKYLQRVIGYCLTGLTTEQAFFFLYGDGSNGKSCLVNILRDLLGHGLAKAIRPETLMVKRSGGGISNDEASLQFARLVETTELADDQRFDEAFVKQLTGGDKIKARRLYHEFFEFTPVLKLFIAGNHRPQIRGTDGGIWRRVQLIPFNARFDKANKDPTLLEKLRAELPGILNWAIVGCREWQRTRLKPPVAVTDAVKAYREDMDTLGMWISECCVSSTTAFAGALYQNYKQWAETGGMKPMTIVAFNRKLADRGHASKHTNKGNLYSTIGLKP